MPTYDYICRACGNEFEEFQSITAPVKRKCPKCGKPKLERLIGTGAGIIFKGGGFYETDYRSEGYKKAAEAEKKASEPAGDSKSESKDKSTTTKTETKAEKTAGAPGASASAEAKPAARVSTKPARSTKSRRKK